MRNEFQELVRIINVDIKGEKKLYHALRSIKGISYSFSNSICKVLDFDPNIKVGNLEESDLKKIEEVIKNPTKHNIPVWLFNRRNDYDTGENKHISAVEINLQRELDVKRLQSIRSYRGIRHAQGLPVRGQRTRAHFRKGTAIGVSKKKVNKGKV